MISKSMVLKGVNHFEARQLTVSRENEDLGLMKVRSTGICASDRYLYSGRHPWTIDYPIVPGHELFGEIIELGDSCDSSLKVGDLVTAQVKIPCLNCEFCRLRKFNLCLSNCHFGSCAQGGFTQVMKLPRNSRLHKFPKIVPDKIGGLAETFANAFYILLLSRIEEGHKVLVLGMGPLGHAVAQILSTEFTSLEFHVLTRQSWKKTFVEELGGKCLPLDQESQNDFSNYFDVVIECSGLPINLETSMKLIKPGGRITLYGVYRDNVNLDFNVISEFKELEIRGGHLANDDAFEMSVRYLTENVNTLEDFVTDVVSFEDFKHAFEERKPGSIKTMFIPERG